MSAITDCLKKARALIEKPENWCQNSMAQNAEGAYVPVQSVHACKFCAIGAIDRADHQSVVGAMAEFVLGHAAHIKFGLSAFGVNDKLGHEAVLAMYDAAITNQLEKSREDERNTDESPRPDRGPGALVPAVPCA